MEVPPQGGATIVGAGADLIFVPAVPAPVQVTFAVRFVGAPDELDGETEHRVVCRLFDPGGEPMGEQGTILKGEIDQRVPGYVAEVTVPMGVVLDAQQAGSYSVEFEIDGHRYRRVPIHVAEQPPPQ